MNPEEIATQPRCWRQAAAVAGDSDLLLPHFGEHVAVIGWGSAWHAAIAYAGLRQQAGHGPTEAFTPTEVPPYRTFDRAVVLTARGEDPWTRERLHSLRREAVITTVITARADSPAADLAGHLIALGFASERTPGTRFATSVMALVRAHLGEELEPIIAGAEEAVRSAPEEAAAFAGHLFLGHGWSLGPANAAASTYRRMGLTAAACVASEWREAATIPVGPGTLAWVFGAPDGSVGEELAAEGAVVRTADRDAMIELVRAQMAATQTTRA